MKITDAIDYDVECVREYCVRLIAFADGATKDLTPQKKDPTRGGNHMSINVAHLVRPDLISNIYSLLDFRLKTLCEHHYRNARATETFEAFRRADKSKSSDLDRYRRYFRAAAKIDLQPVDRSFRHLDLMRQIRNVYIHHGGHADVRTEKIIDGVSGVSMSASVLRVSDAYIYESLDHMAKFLRAIAQG